jgi:hypothetical protein
MRNPNRYSKLIEKVFFSLYVEGATQVVFARTDLAKAAKDLNIALPKNIGDIIYSFRYRTPLPQSICDRAPRGREWIIEPAGRAKYKFALRQWVTIQPNLMMAETKVPDATPGVIAKYALSDEQALLAKVRYNRLVDIFTGVTCYSLQSHLRTTVPHIGQIETDEVYIGVDKRGVHYVFPVQAKSRKDRLSVIQLEQDIAMCASKFPTLVCRAIGAQFMPDGLIALFEFEQSGNEIKIVSERHYRLVPGEEVTENDLASYRQRQH